MEESTRETIRAAGLATLDRFMAALNAHDAAAMDREMHFPHVRLAEGRVTVYERAGSNPMDLFDRLRADDDWRWSRWGRRELVQCTARKAHWLLDYTRYRSDDSVIGVYESLYVMVLEQGRWGILARSSFGP
jgi:hypothetical protein